MKGHPGVLVTFAQHAPGELAISTVTVMEIEYGLAGQPTARERYGQVWSALQADLTILDYQTADARETARLRQHLKQEGTPIGPYDLQLAGAALARGLTLVTHNTREFARAPGLACEDWHMEAEKGG